MSDSYIKIEIQAFNHLNNIILHLNKLYVLNGNVISALRTVNPFYKFILIIRHLSYISSVFCIKFIMKIVE